MTNAERQLLAAGCGRLGFRNGRAMHLAVADAVGRHPELAGLESAIRLGWYAERSDQASGAEPSEIGFAA